MARRNLFSLLLLPLVAGCGGLADSEFTGTAEERVRFAVERASGRVPKRLGDDLTLTGVKGDGRTLVMQFDTTIAGSVDTSPQALTKMFRAQVCDNDGYRSVIDAGGNVRFEISRSRTGEALPAFGIAQCY